MIYVILLFFEIYKILANVLKTLENVFVVFVIYIRHVFIQILNVHTISFFTEVQEFISNFNN